MERRTLLASMIASAIGSRAYASGGGTIDVKTWVERRDDRVTKQAYDFSCGAASVATILKEFYGLAIDEPDVLIELPDEGRKYTFQDLADVVRIWGFTGTGFRLSYDDLAKLKIPAVAHLNYRERDHFTVIRGITPDIVHLADSSMGNRTFRERAFRRHWEKGPEGLILLILPENADEFAIDQAFITRPVGFGSIIRQFNDQRFARSQR